MLASGAASKLYVVLHVCCCLCCNCAAKSLALRNKCALCCTSPCCSRPRVAHLVCSREVRFCSDALMPQIATGLVLQYRTDSRPGNSLSGRKCCAIQYFCVRTACQRITQYTGDTVPVSQNWIVCIQRSTSRCYMRYDYASRRQQKLHMTASVPITA